jgi:hypothetical protein
MCMIGELSGQRLSHRRAPDRIGQGLNCQQRTLPSQVVHNCGVMKVKAGLCRSADTARLWAIPADTGLAVTGR